MTFNKVLEEEAAEVATEIVMYSAHYRQAGERPNWAKMATSFSYAEERERELRRLEREAWVAGIFLNAQP